MRRPPRGGSPYGLNNPGTSTSTRGKGDEQHREPVDDALDAHRGALGIPEEFDKATHRAGGVAVVIEPAGFVDALIGEIGSAAERGAFDPGFEVIADSDDDEHHHRDIEVRVAPVHLWDVLQKSADQIPH